jgi:hypothetical protein
MHSMLAFRGRQDPQCPFETHHELQVARTDSTLVTLDVFVFEPAPKIKRCQSGQKSRSHECGRRNREENPVGITYSPSSM